MLKVKIFKVLHKSFLMESLSLYLLKEIKFPPIIKMKTFRDLTIFVKDRTLDGLTTENLQIPLFNRRILK